MSITILPEHDPGAIARALNEAGWLDEPILAAGQLRQGKAPSMLGMLTGTAVIEVLRPRRSKLLPRHFVLAVTPTRVVAFKASGGSGESDHVYRLHVREVVAAAYPRDAVALTDLAEGSASKGGTMEVRGERFPVSRPNLDGDPSTDELLGALSGTASAAPAVALVA